jgi:hypothetical protein
MSVKMGRKPKNPAGEQPAPKKRNVIFVTLDDTTERRLQLLIDRHRIKPDRAAVALTALIELLDREKIPADPPAD